MAYCTHTDILSLISNIDLAGLTQDNVQDFTAAGTVTNGNAVQYDAVLTNQVENLGAGARIGIALSSGAVGSLVSIQLDAAQLIDPNWTLVDMLTADVDKMIDGKAGQVYAIPFTLDGTPYTPDLINRISKTLTVYRCFARRFTIMEMPKLWADYRKEMMEMLDAISNQLMKFDADVYSTEATMGQYNSQPRVSFWPGSKMGLY